MVITNYNLESSHKVPQLSNQDSVGGDKAQEVMRYFRKFGNISERLNITSDEIHDLVIVKNNLGLALKVDQYFRIDAAFPYRIEIDLLSMEHVEQGAVNRVRMDLEDICGSSQIRH